jgi:sulfur carrier protein
MITVSVNNQRKTLPKACSVADALEALGYRGQKIAVAVNSSFVPRSAYATHHLHGDDCIDVVEPVQGG